MTKPTKRPLTKLQLKRRARILQAVRDQIEAGGYEGVSMRELAELAEVSPKTLYNLYGSKDHLILRAITDLLAQLAKQVELTRTHGLARLLASAQAITNQIVATPHYAETIARLLFNASPDDPVTKVLIHDGIRNFRNSLEIMQEERDLRSDVDLDLFARRLSADNWATIFHWMKGCMTTDELRREFARGTILTLLPAMTPKAARRYQSLILSDTEVRRQSDSEP